MVVLPIDIAAIPCYGRFHNQDIAKQSDRNMTATGQSRDTSDGSVISLFPHQIRAAEFLGRNPRSMLAHDMGTGKSFSAISAWLSHVFPQNLLIVTLASAKRQWAREVHRLYPKATIAVSGDTHWTSPCVDPNVFITNYERLHDPSLKRYWGAVVFDEAHRLKNRQARCTKAAYGKDGIASRANNIWLLTGTPMPNHPGELWTHAKALWGTSMTYAQWEARYCVTREAQWGTQVIAGKNLPELHEHLDRFIDRVRRQDVLDLPPLTIEVWPLAARATLKCGGGRFYDELRERHNVTDETALDDFLASVNSAETLAQIRRETAVLKAQCAAHMLNDEDDKRKTLLFCHHRDAIETLVGALDHSANRITGSTPTRERQVIIDEFNRPDGPRYLIGQIQAAGTGLNLQAAERVIFVESSWVPAENEQAIARAYRHGQTRPVSVRYTYLPGSIDEIITEVLARKGRMAFYDNHG